VGLFDWLSRGGHRDEATIVWHVDIDGSDVVVDDGSGGVFRARKDAARGVRIVPLTGGNHHATTAGWQVALARSDGDVLLGKPLRDWRAARDLARQVCAATNLPLDEMSERMFSRVGQFTQGR
jgi:hypothetical protein